METYGGGNVYKMWNNAKEYWDDDDDDDADDDHDDAADDHARVTIKNKGVP